MSRKTTKAAIIASGVLLAAAMAAPALADSIEDINPGDEGVVVLDIDVEGPTGGGALWMSIADDAATLGETGTQGVYRVFEGTLPAVTVTDSRTGTAVPGEDEVYWYVTGEMTSDFAHTNGVDSIAKEQLGWTPAMLSTSPSGTVDAGSEVRGSLDGGTIGVTNGADYLVSTFDSALVNDEYQWTANAALKLLTAPNVQPGHYEANLTLTLMEDPWEEG